MQGDLLTSQPEIEQPKAEEKPTVSESRKALITSWVSKIQKAKKKWEQDFRRMRENEEFVTGLQHVGQTTIRSDKYVANFVNRLVSQAVATLYARNPQVTAYRRKRLDFAVWDEKIESVLAAGQQVEQAMMMGGPPPMNAWAVLMDYQQGMQKRQQVEKVGETLRLTYQYQTDSQEPEFKTQMKQLVQRVCVCGVGYVRVAFCREDEAELSTSETKTGSVERMQRAKVILDQLQEGKLSDSSKEVEELQNLVQSLQQTVQDHEEVNVSERLLFDFPPAASVIPDEGTRILKGWVGTKWLAQEYYYTADFIQQFFEKTVKGSGAKAYTEEGQQTEANTSGESAPATFCVWDVIDRDSKSHFIICEGFDDYLQEPEPVEPVHRAFWPVKALVFNDVETEKGSKASPFPPSHVDLVWSAQKEHNRSREALRSHRNANRPLYTAPKGTLPDGDKDAINNAEDSQVIELQSVPPGTDPGKVIAALPKIPIDPLVYDSRPLMDDALLTTGAQEANLGPAKPNVTATVGTIAEQSRMTVAASSVDALDDFLSVLAECGGEACLRYMSRDTVVRIVGPGAVWPDVNKDDFLNELMLQIVAASSGRPNKALEIANWERLVGPLMQMGANPQALIRETVKRMDDRMEPSDFFPLPGLPTAPVAPGQAQGAPGGGSPQLAKPQQPLQELQSGFALPLSGA